jgi:hypothetical protein
MALQFNEIDFKNPVNFFCRIFLYLLRSEDTANNELELLKNDDCE